jgi:GNAT superfamily N-acetyltransferase
VIALRTVADVAAACGDDPLIVWAAQDMRPGVRAWADGEAVAVAVPQLSRRDRIAVVGDPTGVANLLRAVLSQVGPTFRPLGDAGLIDEVVGVVPGLEMGGRFGWMDVLPPPVPPRPSGAASAPGWLGEAELGEVDALLDEAFPTSYARPGGSGIRRWAGLREAGGPLLAVAADAWSVPQVGFMGGVATRPAARGRGHAAAVCAFVVRDLLARHGRVALFVDDWNTAAIRMYEQLRFRMRPVAAARWTATC